MDKLLALSEVPGSRRQAELMDFERNHIGEEQDLDIADLWSSRSEDGHSHSYSSTAFDGSKLSEIGWKRRAGEDPDIGNTYILRACCGLAEGRRMTDNEVFY
jgi:hypothetical protein